MGNNDTKTLEWLLEKDLSYQLSTMFDNEDLNFKYIIENEKVSNDVGSDKTFDIDKSESNILKTFDYRPEQKKINIKDKKMSDDIRKSLDNVNAKRIKYSNTFYKKIFEYHGVVEAVDNVHNRFKAVLTNSKEPEDVLSAEFNISDIGYESDKKLISVGVQIIWMIGQEQQIIERDGILVPGTIQNMSKFIIRRPQGLNEKRKREAKDEATKWAGIFRRFESTDAVD